jgi:hypothetical protein
MALDDYFDFGPQNPTGQYAKSRENLDGVLGFFDGVSSLANSVGRTVGTVADTRAAWAGGQAAVDDTILSREEREQGILLTAAGFERGDNVQMYYVVGAVALALVVLYK